MKRKISCFILPVFFGLYFLQRTCESCLLLHHGAFQNVFIAFSMKIEE